VRNYTRKASAEGIWFAPDLSPEEYESGVSSLNSVAEFFATPGRLARDRRLMTLHGGGRRCGLRAPDGRFVAVLCGFSKGPRFHVLSQLNDRRLAHLSLSTVLRGHLAQELIASGHEVLQFVGGGGALGIGRFCEPERYRSIFIEKQTGALSVAKRLASWIVDLLAASKMHVPKSLELASGGFLREHGLRCRTALEPPFLAAAPVDALSGDAPGQDVPQSLVDLPRQPYRVA
jgi:hypothetical protein